MGFPMMTPSRVCRHEGCVRHAGHEGFCSSCRDCQEEIGEKGFIGFTELPPMPQQPKRRLDCLFWALRYPDGDRGETWFSLSDARKDLRGRDLEGAKLVRVSVYRRKKVKP